MDEGGVVVVMHPQRQCPFASALAIETRPVNRVPPGLFGVKDSLVSGVVNHQTDVVRLSKANPGPNVIN